MIRKFHDICNFFYHFKIYISHLIPTSNKFSFASFFYSSSVPRIETFTLS